MDSGVLLTPKIWARVSHGNLARVSILSPGLHDGRESERRRDTRCNVGRASETAVSECVNVAVAVVAHGPRSRACKSVSECAVAVCLSGRWFGLVP